MAIPPVEGDGSEFLFRNRADKLPHVEQLLCQGHVVKLYQDTWEYG